MLHSSWRLALNTLGGKPGRTALMVSAVALAASLVVAVSCAIASVQASLELGIVRFLGAADARIIHPGNGRFGDDLLEEVRSWPEVEHAAGRLSGSLTLVHADLRRHAESGELLRETPAALGVDFEIEPHFRDIEFIEGRLPDAKNEILIDPITAELLNAKVGDELVVQRFGEPISLMVAGIFDRQRLGAVQRPLVELDRGVLAEASGLSPINGSSPLTSIFIILKEGEDVAAFCKRREAELPKTLVIEPAEMVRSGFDRQIVASRFGFVVGSVLTFMCASFIIVTALTTSVTERQREMAVTRCIGASRAQLFASQIVAGGILSAAGALVGIPFGIGLTWVLTVYFSEMLPAGLTLHALGLQLAAVGSIAAGLLGALYPAWMASHVSPLQAMAFPARQPRVMSIVICGGVALVLIGIQVALFTINDPSTRFMTYVYIGLPLLLLGYFVLAVPLLVMVVKLISGVFSRGLGLPPGMLSRSMIATPFRHGFTAGALMVGIAILVSTWSSAQSVMNDWLSKIKFADGFAYSRSGITPRAQETIAALPFVESVCPIGLLPLRIHGEQVFGVRGLAPPSVTCVGFDPDRFFSMNAVEWAAGEPENAIARLKDGSGIIVADRFLTTQRVKLGDKLMLGAGRVQREFEIVGAVNSVGLDIATQMFGIRNQYMEHSISCVFMDWNTVKRVFDNHDAHMLQVNLVDDISDDEAEERIEEAVAHASGGGDDRQRGVALVGGVEFFSGRWILARISQVSTAVLTVQSTVAFAALVLACIGVGNVILAGIHARRFEYGVLRAVGAQRALLARLIFAEAAVLALAGALTGTLLGLHLAWVGAMNYRDLAGLPLRLALPEIPTAIGWLVLLALTLLAALPGVIGLLRRQPSALLAAGRHGY